MPTGWVAVRKCGIGLGVLAVIPMQWGNTSTAGLLPLHTAAQGLTGRGLCVKAILTVVHPLTRQSGRPH